MTRRVAFAAGVAGAFACIVGLTASSPPAYRVAKVDLGPVVNGIPQVRFADPPQEGKTFSGQRWHGAPQPLEQNLLALNHERLRQFQALPGTFDAPCAGMTNTECMLAARQLLPTYLTGRIANAYNHMVAANMPGYAGKAPLPQLSEDQLRDARHRLHKMREYIREGFPALSPEMDPAFDSRDPAVRHLVVESMRAAEQMGHAMLDFYDIRSKEALAQTPPAFLPHRLVSEGMCTSMWESLGAWEHAKQFLDDEVRREEGDISLAKFREGISAMCS